MRLTRETEYALRGLAALTRRNDPEPLSLAEIADAEGLPPSFLAKIFQKLARHGILQSIRGAGKGYSLAAAPESLSVLEVIEAIEGSDYLERCIFWGGRCGGESPCMLHERWAEVKPAVKAVLENTTLAELAGVAAPPAGEVAARSGRGTAE